eukprot:COSAG01_NODE_3621_length_5860_cov_4.719840_6_plen_49_part_00
MPAQDGDEAQFSSHVGTVTVMQCRCESNEPSIQLYVSAPNRVTTGRRL